MDPIPYFYKPINRMAILIRPKQPFFDWLNTAAPEPGGPINHVEEHTVYLIREMDNNDLARNWVKRHFDKLFVNELNDWITDESTWPENRNYKLFTQWFDVEIHSMVLDLEEGPVEKDVF